MEPRTSTDRPVLYEPQEKDVKRLIELITDAGLPVVRETSETGLGKSIVAMEIAKRLDMLMVVVCPKGVVASWQSKFKKFSHYGNCQTRISADEQTKTPIKLRHHIITTYDQVKSAALSTVKDMVEYGTRTTKYQYAIFRGNGRRKTVEEITLTPTGRQKKRKEKKRAGVEVVVTGYFITQSLVEIAKEYAGGILFVMDESHKAKNDTQTGAMVTSICQKVTQWRSTSLDEDGKIRLSPKASIGRHTSVLLMSATPLDDDSQVQRMLCNIGALDIRKQVEGGDYLEDGSLDARRLVSYCTKGPDFYVPTYEVLKSCQSDIVRGSDVRSEEPRTWNSGPQDVIIRANFVQKCQIGLWSRSALPTCTSEMQPFVERNCYRGLFIIDDPETSNNESLPVHKRFPNSSGYFEKLQLIRTSGFDARRSGSGKERKQGIKATLEQMETLCVWGVCYATYLALSENHTRKVVIFINYIGNGIEIIKTLQSMIRDGVSGGKRYDLGDNDAAAGKDFIRPAWVGSKKKGEKKVEGEASRWMKDEDVQKSINFFQQDSGTCRVLVMTAGKGQGIDLHDTSKKGRQRYVFSMPNYSVMTLHQQCGRVARAGSTTVSQSFVFYPFTAGMLCSQLLEAISRRSGKIRGSTYSDSFGSRRRYPSDYPMCFCLGANKLYVDNDMIEKVALYSREKQGVSVHNFTDQDRTQAEAAIGVVEDSGKDIKLFIDYCVETYSDPNLIVTSALESNGSVPSYLGPPLTRLTTYGGRKYDYGALVMVEGKMIHFKDTTVIPNTYEEGVRAGMNFTQYYVAQLTSPGTPPGRLYSDDSIEIMNKKISDAYTSMGISDLLEHY